MKRVLRSQDRYGFAFTDLLFSLAVIGLLAALSAPLLTSIRTNAGSIGSQSNLQQLGEAHASYSDANGGFIGGFSWPGAQPRPGNPEYFYDIGCGETSTQAFTNLAGAQFQLASILRKATGRCGEQDGAITPNLVRIPHRRYSHHPLLDWMGASPTDPLAVSPLDTHLQDFQSLTTLEGYADLPGGDPDTALGTWQAEANVRLWTFASSYLTTVYAYSDSTPTAGQMPLVPQSNGVLMLAWVDGGIRPQPRYSVRYPSLKTHLFEEMDYTGGLGNQGLFYANPDASVNVLAFDGSSRRVATVDTNPGWDPSIPRRMESTTSLRYRSIDSRFFPDDGDRHDPYPGTHNWTRGGLFGIDFGAGEINTSEW